MGEQMSDATVKWHNDVAHELAMLSENGMYSRNTNNLMRNGSLSIGILLLRQDKYLAVLGELRDAIMNGLCNGGTPAFEGGPDRLDKAIEAVDELLPKQLQSS